MNKFQSNRKFGCTKALYAHKGVPENSVSELRGADFSVELLFICKNFRKGEGDQLPPADPARGGLAQNLICALTGYRARSAGGGGR